MNIEKIERNGEIFAVLPISVYEKLLDDAEMLEDIATFDAALQLNEPSLPLDVWDAIEQNIGFGIVALRNWKKLSQLQLSQISDIDQSLLNDIESGKKQIDNDILAKIAKALDLSLDIFY